jgi:hypothetical protein
MDLAFHAASCCEETTSRQGKAKSNHDDLARAIDARL